MIKRALAMENPPPAALGDLARVQFPFLGQMQVVFPARMSKAGSPGGLCSVLAQPLVTAIVGAGQFVQREKEKEKQSEHHQNNE